MARVVAQPLRGRRRQRAHGEAGCLGEACHHVAVAAVVAATADDGDTHGARPAAAQRTQGALTRALHQRVTGDAAGDCARVEVAHLGSRIHRARHGHAFSILMRMPSPSRPELLSLARRHGFDDIGVAGVELPEDEAWMLRWLELGRHGEMHYMQRHGTLRSRPAQLQPGALRALSLRMDYWPGAARDAAEVLADPTAGYVSRYALGRDYHRVMRPALARFAAELATITAEHEHRVFVDSAPLLEKALARNAGLGWIGKHTNLINRSAGSWFFLGEVLTDLPLPIDAPATAHCGSCSACIPACPTGAIVAPYQLDARLCISYLTIELDGPIPEELRALIGNRIYGCDDCQLVCPWNKFARAASHPDFHVRHGLDSPRLTELMRWSREDFAVRMAGSAIHRIGYERFLRNVAVALGNGPPSAQSISALEDRIADASALLREHIEWALRRLRSGAPRAQVVDQPGLAEPGGREHDELA
jgi:epoxyqueuosine reductase